MNIRYASFAATLSVVGLLVLLSRADPSRLDRDGPPPVAEAPPGTASDPAGLPSGSGAGPGAAEGEGGSALPCAVPLAWRIARVDSPFGVSMDEATAALREAAALWDEAVDTRLFVVHPAGSTEGFPVRLLHDERQARAEERQEREEELLRERQVLEARQSELDDGVASHDAAYALHARWAGELERRIQAHNDVVRRWNTTGGAPEAVVARHEAKGEALAEERARFEEERRRLEATRLRLKEEEERLAAGAAELNRRWEELVSAFPPMRVEAGLYREAVRTEAGRPRAVGREIRVHRFDDRAELVRVLAHELGHALGLGHADEAGALMSQGFDQGGAPVPGSVRPPDLALLRSVCPGL